MYQGGRRTVCWTATNAVEPIAPVSRQTLFTGLAKITMELRGLSSCGAVLHAAHDPCDALSHREPLLDPVMAASSARFGITHTTPTNHLPMTRSTFKWVCNNLAHDLDMTLDTMAAEQPHTHTPRLGTDLTRSRRELAASTQTHPMNTPWSDYFQHLVQDSI
jgi:hypothetical protein